MPKQKKPEDGVGDVSGPAHDGVKVHILNEAGEVVHIVAVGSLELPFRIVVEGRSYEHVSEAADGSWQYAPR